MRYDEQKQLVLHYLQARWSPGGDSAALASTKREQERSTTTRETTDPPSVQQLLAAIRQACPTLVLTINDMLAERTHVIVRWTLTGTDSQGYQGRLPTGKPITISGIQLIRCEQDQLVEEWEIIDRLDPLLQLGFVCLPKPPTITLRRPDYMPGTGTEERTKR